MTKSELIERLASQQPHIPAKAVEDAVKEMLEHMASTLARGERIEIRGFGSFLCTIVLHVPGVTRKLAIKSSWKVSTFHTLSRVKNCAIAPIFTATEFSQPVKLGSKESTCGCFFVAVAFFLKVPRIFRFVFCNPLNTLLRLP